MVVLKGTVKLSTQGFPVFTADGVSGDDMVNKGYQLLPVSLRWPNQLPNTYTLFIRDKVVVGYSLPGTQFLVSYLYTEDERLIADVQGTFYAAFGPYKPESELFEALKMFIVAHQTEI